MSQNRLILDAPLSYTLAEGHVWQVHNFSKTYSGEMPLRTALALSKNTPAVRLMELLSPEAVIDFARRTGIRSAQAQRSAH